MNTSLHGPGFPLKFPLSMHVCMTIASDKKLGGWGLEINNHHKEKLHCSHMDNELENTERMLCFSSLNCSRGVSCESLAMQVCLIACCMIRD